MKKLYKRIDSFRLLNIKIIIDGNSVFYEGMVENLPKEIRHLKYS